MFKFNGKEYEYVDMKPNQTRVNERRMEIALGFEFLEEHKGKKILEVGNVCNHYKPRKYYTHDVLDLYEKVPWLDIMNEDILSWEPKIQYDAVLSISTLEHTDDPTLAINRVLGMAPHVLITVPYGYGNGWIEKLNLPKEYCFYMHRISEDNDWEQTTKEIVSGTKYGKPYPFANAILVIKK